MVRTATFLVLGILALGLTAGCNDNPTNAPTADAVEKANEDRFKAIDNDPNMTQEQKELLKSKLGGVKGSGGQGGSGK